MSEGTLAIWPLALATVSGAVVFLVGYQHLTTGYKNYEKRFVSSVSSTLRDAFIFYDPRRILNITLASAALGAILGFYQFGVAGAVVTTGTIALLPQPILRHLRKRRIALFVEQLPDCLSVMAACLRAGMNLTRVLEQVAKSQPKPLSQEFSLIMAEQRVGRTLRESLDDLHQRIPTQEVELLNSAIVISRSVGGNLAGALDTLAGTLREKAVVEGKITALTAQGRMQSRVAIALPIVVAYALHRQEPEAMSVLYTHPIGWTTLAVLAVLLLLAWVVIRKIVSIDV